MTYFVSTRPTPLLNTRDFQAVFGGSNGFLLFDEKKLVRALEMVAFPRTVFEVIKRHGSFILEVRTAEYPCAKPLYLDKRFGEEKEQMPPIRAKTMPSPEVLIKRMRDRIGKPYIWGGNYAAGIPELMKYYPPPLNKTLNALEKVSWTFQGVDCSGLLYEASDGALPRNTEDLLFVGKGIPISHLSWEEISRALRPLDLIVWRGHVMIVLDHTLIIESCHERGGVCTTTIKKRLDSIRDVDRKKPLDDPLHILQDPSGFLVRRFIF